MNGYLATATMHSGFQILDRDFEVILEYKEHDSLAYGVDFMHQPLRQGFGVASCSFYDHLLTVWNFQDESL